jgi:hypothetical protein
MGGSPHIPGDVCGPYAPVPVTTVQLLVNPGLGYELDEPVLSEWECHLFAPFSRSMGVVWRPEAGREPSAFHRLMQRLVFGCHWRRVKR